MRLQFWSYNYEPEPSGIAPLTAAVARELVQRGHSVEVVAAHPHYPEARWGSVLRPYRETRSGVEVFRLPIWVGRSSAAERIRQELSFTLGLGLMSPFLAKCDVRVVVSPSFPGLLPAMLSSKIHAVPWVLWLQDILPDGAVLTGLLQDGMLVHLARRFEQLAYRRASKIVVIADSFVENLRRKGVPQQHIARIYNPTTRPVAEYGEPHLGDGKTVLTMGNIGYTQNLVNITRAFQESRELTKLAARFVMAGDGVEGDNVRAAIYTNRAEVTGVLGQAELDRYLKQAAIAAVTQRYEGSDFNVPSKLMNFMGSGIPVVAAVRQDSEVSRILDLSGGGWVASNGPGEFVDVLARTLQEPEERIKRGQNALKFAYTHFSIDRIADHWEELLSNVAKSFAKDSRSGV